MAPLGTELADAIESMVADDVPYERPDEVESKEVTALEAPLEARTEVAKVELT